MKKILLALSLVFLMCSNVFSAQSFKLVDDNDVNIDSRGYSTYIVDGTTIGYKLVPIATIIPGTHKILGYSVWPKSTSYDLRVALYDDNSTGVERNLLINESEQSATDYSPKWLPYPRKIQYGLVVWCPGGTDIVIYYTK